MSELKMALLFLLAFVIFEVAYIAWSMYKGIKTWFGSRELSTFEKVNNKILQAIYNTILSVRKLFLRK